MRKETKILIGIMAVLILALPLMSNAMATEDDGQQSDESSTHLKETFGDC